MPGLWTPADEFRLYASLYREALNSLSLRYQFLCYYKIAEGISARRGRLAAAVQMVIASLCQANSRQNTLEPWIRTHRIIALVVAQ